jgi:hypothetical protein
VSHRFFAGRVNYEGTTLALLADEEFWRRQAALEDAAAREIEARPVIDKLDLLVFRKH